ncbi:sigma-54-dependent transcriptional regulator [Allomesorhizobium alhagi]|uniref:Two component sigma-54 specific Fis family transcriptional regulator n=1 Tax=Mesorhizobium alhagi CCNWXJ12-2 TaxID=1107882 RepID=H0HX79_9HYPH|nr:sigma-54 dependent transcriptional regulator [Mesorhizobium alhagi]EHK54676.1 two component sigma-54 specific Fis family transcriptional regulator [Mesorhizobium alhagi CCNWXJ12-2]
MSDLPGILIVDDEIRTLEALRRILSEDFVVHIASDTKAACSILEMEWIQVILCDQRMPGTSGIEFLKQARIRWPDIVRMIISGYTDAHDIIDGINEAGIYQYITKPWHPENLTLTLKNAVQLYALQRENELLAVEMRMAPCSASKLVLERRKALKRDYDFNDGIIRSPTSPMNAVRDALKQVAPFDVPVLLIGASGTGKELAARALHYGSLRWNKPFVVENCGALPDQLLESELFGHKRGAFTGAVENHVGLFERANGGTVFLDEIGEVSPAFQVKLLRVLQESEIRPVGSGRTRKVDVRVVAATNRDLEEELRQGRFRADLFYRLAGTVIRLPALRERLMDIEILSAAVLGSAERKLGKNVPGISDEAIACFRNYSWPGNVRELQNEIQHMLVMGKEGQELGADLVSRHILMAAPAREERDGEEIAELTGTLRERVSEMELRIIRETLIRHRWNKSKAAKELGLSRVGLRGKLERFGLENVKPLPARRVLGGRSV